MAVKHKPDVKKKVRGGQQVRMGDVARAARVSAITVSRTLLTPEKVAPDTRLRVESAIRKLNYVPNLAAGTLAARKSSPIPIARRGIRCWVT
jgi:LacI family transcriptional regulator, gluconate utilization system Gnt-I transcriptional repressor